VTAADRAARRVDRVDVAAQLHAAGWPMRQIARFLHVSDSTIRSDLRAAAAPLRPSSLPRPWVGDWRPEAVRLRESGHPDHRNSQLMPLWMISDRLGVSERDVRRHLARLRNRESRADRAVWLRTAGQSLRQIATTLGVSEATVRRDLAARPVRHLPARKARIVPASAPAIAHPDDAPQATVVPLRRIAR
jgi:lambda repressor-like predicted transcriptional regulator